MAHLVITIGCEYGAKGNQIGKKYQHIIKMYIRKARGTKWHILLLQ